MPQTRRDFWENKISRNKERDKEVSRFYKKEGWSIVRIWEHDIHGNVTKVLSGLLIKIKKHGR